MKENGYSKIRTERSNGMLWNSFIWRIRSLMWTLEGRQRNRGGGSDLDPGGADRPGDHLQIPAYQPGPDYISENYK